MEMGNEGSQEYQEISSQLGGQPESGTSQQTATLNGPDAVQQQQQQQQQPAPSSWNGQEWSLKFRDKVVVPRDRQHLINLAQQGLSYSQSMEALKRQKEQMEQQYAPYQQLSTLLQQDPALAQRIASVLQEHQMGQQYQAQPQQQQQQYAVPPEMQSTVQELQQWRQQMMEQQADTALTSEIDALKKAYPDQPWDVPDDSGMTLIYKTMKHAYDGNYPSLQAAYRDMSWDTHMTAAKAAALKGQQVQQQQAVKSGVITGGASTAAIPRPAGGYQPGQSYNQLAEAATQELMNKT